MNENTVVDSGSCTGAGSSRRPACFIEVGDRDEIGLRRSARPIYSPPPAQQYQPNTRWSGDQGMTAGDSRTVWTMRSRKTGWRVRCDIRHVTGGFEVVTVSDHHAESTREHSPSLSTAMAAAAHIAQVLAVSGWVYLTIESTL